MIRKDGHEPSGTDTLSGLPPDDATSSDARSQPRARVLAVGNMMPPRDLSDDPEAAELSCLPFAEVTAAALDRIRPDVVFSSLVGPEFDCLDLAERLAAAGYRGKYRAVAAQVADPRLVRREITERFPMLDFDVIVLADRD